MPKRKKAAPCFWTADELATLQRFYGKMPLRELHEKHIRTRSINGIQQQAFKLGLTADQKQTQLTEQEIELIKTRAANGMSTKEIREKYMPNRGYKQVAKKAQQLGFGRRPAPDPTPKQKRDSWSNREIGLLRKHYGTMSVEALQKKYIPKRTVQGITNKAYTLHLGDRAHDGWSAEEIELLKLHAGKIPASEIHAKYIPDKSPARINSKSTTLGLTVCKHKNHWTEQELDILRQYYGEIKTARLMKMLPGRTVMSLRHGARRLLAPDTPADPIAVRNQKNPPTTRYAHIRPVTVVLNSLKCSHCGEILKTGRTMLLCPECAATFCEGCRPHAEAHFKSHANTTERGHAE